MRGALAWCWTCCFETSATVPLCIECPKCEWTDYFNISLPRHLLRVLCVYAAIYSKLHLCAALEPTFPVRRGGAAAPHQTR